MANHEEMLRGLAGYLRRTGGLYPRGSMAGEKNDAEIAACLAGADALVLLKVFKAGPSGAAWDEWLARVDELLGETAAARATTEDHALFDAATAIFRVYGPPSDYSFEARQLWEALGAALEARWYTWTPLGPPLACMAPSGDGRNCDKPRGHTGLHWTYGRDTLSWADEPSATREAE